MNPSLPHARRKATVSWPAALPRTLRGATNAGAHGFCFHHQPLCESELFDGHRIALTTHLLAVVARGNLVLRRGEETLVVQEGGAVLMAAGELEITEGPATAAHAAEVFYFLFGDKLVRQRFGHLARIEKMANAMEATATELFALPNFVAHLAPVARAAGFSFPGGLTQMLNFTFNHGWRGAWMFLKGFLARRRRLHLFLENHVLPQVSARSIANAYAGGSRQFRRDFRAQYDVPLERWLTWRRLDLARVRLRHGRPVPVEEVAAWAGYRSLQRFRQQFHARFHLWPEEVSYHDDYAKLSPAQRAVAVAPFWHWAYSYFEVMCDAELAAMHHAQCRQLPRWEQRRQRRNDEEIRQDKIARAAERLDLHDQETLEVVQTDSKVSPPRVNIVEFTKLESFLKPAAVDLPLAA